jgi:hypothetical protein
MGRCFYIFVLLLLSSCGTWEKLDIPYDKELYLETLHVHFYDHNTCEWSCLVMEEGIYCTDDTLKMDIRKNKIGEITKVKLIK